MTDSHKLCAVMNFYYLLGNNAEKTALMLQTAYKQRDISETQVYKRLSQFKMGEMVIEDQPRSGRPTSA